MTQKFYKAAKTDGWDFYTGRTINYRSCIGKTTKALPIVDNPEICSKDVIHASTKALDALSYAEIPCALFLVKGSSVVEQRDKRGFFKLKVLKEITDLDKAFGFKYSEVINPVHPFKIEPPEIGEKEIELLKAWIGVRGTARDSIRDSIRDSVRASVVSVHRTFWISVWNLVCRTVGDLVGDSIWDSVYKTGSVYKTVSVMEMDSVRDSVWDSVWVYTSSLFPDIFYTSSLFTAQAWKTSIFEKFERGGKNPYQSCIDLWRMGLVPIYDGKNWYLYGGPEGKILFKLEEEK